MSVGELLDRVQAVYCDQFRSTLRATSGEADLVVRAGNGQMDTRSVDSNSLLSFEPFEFRWGHSLRVRLAPFFWDSLRIRLTSEEVSRDWSPLSRWFYKWFREADDGTGERLLDAVHFLSDPELRDGETRFTLDLGSAPVPAFEQLLDAVATMGFRTVHLER